MRWTVAVFAATLVIFVAATAGVTDDGQAGGRLGDEERVGVTFEVNIAPEEAPQVDSGGEPSGTTPEEVGDTGGTQPPDADSTEDADDWSGGWAIE